MKKLSLIALFLLISISSAFAQKQGISIGANGLFPVGEWAEIANIGYGGSLTYEHPIGRNVLGVIYSGYTMINGSGDETILLNTYQYDYDWTMIPLMAGAKMYFSGKNDFYGVLLLGANFISLSANGDQRSYEESDTEFAANFNIGYELAVGSNGAVDISAGYVYISGFSYIGARLAYIFKL